MMKKYEVENHEYSLLPKDKEWKLVWSDEFDGDRLDESKWSFRLNYWGMPFDGFTDKGVELDGNSNLVFKPTIIDGRLCTSQLQTGENSFDCLDFEGAIKNRVERNHGNNPWGQQVEIWPLKPLKKAKFAHRYGYYEARVKFQKCPFWWSAFWTQTPTIGASANPEYAGVESDIMEYFVDGTLTSGNIYNGYGKQFSETARVHYPYAGDDEWHRFGMSWDENGYVFYFDGKETARSNEPVSKVEQFILLSTEIQGYRSDIHKTTWTEEELNDRFIVDYVRVFDEVK
ncbi:MAG: glycosyl hydrolase family protein [Clostridiales bacterium]|nr:glycosyl hydrolase family protein [Clostridiales bacterium]